MFASTKVLGRYGVTYSYIENCRLDDPVFEDGFESFLQVVSVVKTFRNMRVAVVSARPKEFMSVMVNEAELLEKFDIEIVPAESTVITGMIDWHLANNKEGIDGQLKELADRGIDLSRLGDKKRSMAAIKLAMKEFAEKNRCVCIASECWKLFKSRYGIAPCFVFGELNDALIPTACETDVHGAVMGALAVAAKRFTVPSYVADLTIRHPEDDNVELLWHCGPFAKSLIRKNAGGYVAEGGQGFYEIEHGEQTVLRFDGARGDYFMFAGTGRGIDGPVTNGNYLWLEVDDWVRWEKKFIFGPYIHHVIGIPGDVTETMREACRYIGVTFDPA